jgi:hypothetical protein
VELAVPSFLNRLIPSLTGFDVKIKYNDLLKKMMNEEVESHKLKLVPGEPKASEIVFVFHLLITIYFLQCAPKNID